MALLASELTKVCFRTLLCLLGIFGNVTLLFYSIPKMHYRNETYKMLLFNLAVSDLLTNCLVQIPGILVEISGTWFLGNSFCKIFWFISSLSVTNSILTTLIISIFWFWKLVGSRPNILRKVEVQMLMTCILLSWVVATIFSAPLLIFSRIHIMRNESNEHRQRLMPNLIACYDSFPSKLHKHMYELVYLIIANVFPIVIILFTNVRTVMALIQNRKRIKALKCVRHKGTSTYDFSNRTIPSISTTCEDVAVLEKNCQKLEAIEDHMKNVSCKQPMPCVSGKTKELGFITIENSNILKQDSGSLEIIVSNIDRKLVLQTVLEKTKSNEDQQLVSLQCDPYICSPEKASQKVVLYNMKTSHLLLIPESQTMCVAEDIEQPTLCHLNESSPVFLCPRTPTKLSNAREQLPSTLIPTNPPKCQFPTLNKNIPDTTKIRATISILTVVGVFFIFWVIHLALRIKINTGGSQQFIDMASIIATSYTVIIPYTFLYGMKKCPCQKRAH